MSMISKLLTLGAAGAGGQSYWISEVGALNSYNVKAGQGVQGWLNPTYTASGYSEGTVVVSRLDDTYSPDRQVALFLDSEGQQIDHYAMDISGFSNNTVKQHGPIVLMDSGDFYTAWTSQDRTGLFGDYPMYYKFNLSTGASGGGYQLGESAYYTAYCKSWAYNSSSTDVYLTMQYSNAGDDGRIVQIDQSNPALYPWEYCISYDSGSYNVRFQDTHYCSVNNVYYTVASGVDVITPQSGSLFNWRPRPDDTGVYAYGTSGYWTRAVKDSSSSSDFYNVTTDSSGNIFAVGDYGAYLTVCKFNSSGTLLFKKKFGDPSTSGGGISRPYVCCDENDNVIIAARMEADAPDRLASSGNGRDSLIMSLSNDGSTINWRCRFGTTSTGDTMPVAVGGKNLFADGNGAFYYTLAHFYSTGSTAAVAKLPTDGSFITGTLGTALHNGSWQALTETIRSLSDWSTGTLQSDNYRFGITESGSLFGRDSSISGYVTTSTETQTVQKIDL